MGAEGGVEWNPARVSEVSVHVLGEWVGSYGSAGHQIQRMMFACFN